MSARKTHTSFYASASCMGVSDQYVLLSRVLFDVDIPLASALFLTTGSRSLCCKICTSSLLPSRSSTQPCPLPPAPCSHPQITSAAPTIGNRSSCCASCFSSHFPPPSFPCLHPRIQVHVPHVTLRPLLTPPDYKRRTYYWESVILLRKLFLVIAAVFLGSVSNALQLSVMLAVVVVALSWQMLSSPYRIHHMNTLVSTVEMTNFHYTALSSPYSLEHNLYSTVQVAVAGAEV